MQSLLVNTLSHAFQVPEFKTSGAAGLDIYAAEDKTVIPHEATTLKTGFRVILPRNTVGLIKPRSGIYHQNLIEINGVIDEDYRGEVFIMIHNHNPTELFVIKRGDRIAQMVIMVIPETKVTLVTNEDFNNHKYATGRGDGGFGSTNAESSILAGRKALLKSLR